MITNEEVKRLQAELADITKYYNKQIWEVRKKCNHKFGDEWSEYNIYKKRCEKCGYVHEVEY